MLENIFIRGTRTHNLKNIDVTLPRDKLIVITGLSPALNGGYGNRNLRLFAPTFCPR